GLLAAYIFTITYAFVVVTILARRNVYLVNPLPEVFSGCPMIFPNNIWMIYILPIIWEWTVLGLTIWKIWSIQRSYGTTPLMQRLADNGVAYFIVLLFLFLFLCIGGSIDPIKIASNGSGFITAISSIVCGRVILSLHQFEDSQRASGSLVDHSTTRLTTAILMSELSPPTRNYGLSPWASATSLGSTGVAI
ncbi:hypothetical protein FRC12_010303, partial [Ceratobasidium sp. 428]